MPSFHRREPQRCHYKRRLRGFRQGRDHQDHQAWQRLKEKEEEDKSLKTRDITVTKRHIGLHFNYSDDNCS